MGFMERINKMMGVEPPNVKKRIVIGSTAILVVTVFDIIVLLAWAGSIGVINLFGITFVPVEQIDRVAKMIIFLSVLFAISIIYYMVLPTKKEEPKQPIYGQYVWTLRERI